MLTRMWKSESKFNANARLEECTYSDGSIHYSFRDRLGRPSDVDADEVPTIIRNWKMIDVTEEAMAEGWIL